MSKIEAYKELIHDLANLLDGSTLSEIEVEEDNFRIRVARETSHSVTHTLPAAPAAPAPAAPPAIAATQAPSDADSAPKDADHPGAVPSPMVGTVYMASSPESPDFISVGDTVKKGDTLLIVEAMKVMNNIPSPRAGVVKKILVANAQPVEFGEALVIIE